MSSGARANEPEWTTWPEAFVAALAADPRVVGAAQLASLADQAGSGIVVIATTWDGLLPLTVELPRVGALAALGDTDAAAAADLIAHQEGASFTAVTLDARRVEVRLVRIGDLKPCAMGEGARAVYDPKGHMEQWAKWSAGRPPESAQAKSAVMATERGAQRAKRLLATDLALRAPALRSGRELPDKARETLARFVHDARSGIDENVAAEAAMARRLDAVIGRLPRPRDILRVTAGGHDPARVFEDFLLVADGEGFLGDRVLFQAAATQLAELSRRTPVFDEGFVLPTFDAVEVRWRFGDGVGGCKIPLIPAVHVGVGVTPQDHLEFWAAPAVREATSTVAAIADTGERRVVERTVSKADLLTALSDVVGDAWERLPDFLRNARRAGRRQEPDLAAAWKPLHLPKSFVAGAVQALGTPTSTSRLAMAMALARSGNRLAPLMARKCGLAAGRLIDTTPAAE